MEYPLGTHQTYLEAKSVPRINVNIVQAPALIFCTAPVISHTTLAVNIQTIDIHLNIDTFLIFPPRLVRTGIT